MPAAPVAVGVGGGATGRVELGGVCVLPDGGVPGVAPGTPGKPGTWTAPGWLGGAAGGATWTVDLGPLAILSRSSSTSSPCFSVTTSGLTSATVTPFSDSPACTVCDLPPLISRRNAVATFPTRVVPVSVYCPCCACVAACAVGVAGGAGRRVGLKSDRSTVSRLASTPPLMPYSGRSATPAGEGPAFAGAGPSGVTSRPQSVS
jgi:hypothetical protein